MMICSQPATYCYCLLLTALHLLPRIARSTLFQKKVWNFFQHHNFSHFYNFQAQKEGNVFVSFERKYTISQFWNFQAQNLGSTGMFLYRLRENKSPQLVKSQRHIAQSFPLGALCRWGSQNPTLSCGITRQIKTAFYNVVKLSNLHATNFGFECKFPFIYRGDTHFCLWCVSLKP